MSTIFKSLGTLIFVAISVFLLPENVVAQDYDFEQIDDDFGIVCMEAENFSDQIIPGDSYWEFVEEPEWYSGDGAVQALPESGPAFADAASALAGAPALIYRINFVKVDSVFIWIRGCHAGGGDDSFHAGIDGEILPTTERIGFHGEPYDEWVWLGINMANTKPVFYIDTPGIHEFGIYMRESGLRIDKIVLTTSRDYDPLMDGDEGPPETLPTSVEPLLNTVVLKDFRLDQNYPNPFNPSTKISYELSSSSHVNIKIYDALGNWITTLVNGIQTAGRYEVSWNATDANNIEQTSGIYFAQLQAQSQTRTIQMLFMR